MDAMTEFSLTVTQFVRAPAKRVYEAWLDPDLLARFMVSRPDVTIPGASTDPRVGGRFDVMMVIDGKDLPHGGVYTGLVPYERIVFEWESPHVAGATTVTGTLAPTDDGTEVTLTHTRFLDAGVCDAHKTGWTRILEKLAEVLT
jgi:uncharacterized protein YndB with AHSA1/START domain